MYKFTNVVETEEFFSTSNVVSHLDRNINNISVEFGESDPFAYISIVSSDDNILTITAGYHEMKTINHGVNEYVKTDIITIPKDNILYYDKMMTELKAATNDKDMFALITNYIHTIHNMSVGSIAKTLYKDLCKDGETIDRYDILSTIRFKSKYKIIDILMNVITKILKYYFEK